MGDSSVAVPVGGGQAQQVEGDAEGDQGEKDLQPEALDEEKRGEQDARPDQQDRLDLGPEGHAGAGEIGAYQGAELFVLDQPGMETVGTAGKTGQGQKQEGDGGKNRQKEAEKGQGDAEPAAGEKEPAQE